METVHAERVDSAGHPELVEGDRLMPKLGVNIDHVATLRQARQGKEPDPVSAALDAVRAGCDSIVCHLREDRRHIQDRDLPALKWALKVPLNLEMAAHPEIVRIACGLKPAQATLVPEKRHELTTEGGLDLRRGGKRLSRAIKQLSDAGIRVSLFIDPAADSIRRAAELGVPMIELHTGRYAAAAHGVPRRKELEKLKRAVHLGREEGLIVAAGHGLDYRNVRPVAAIPQVEELNIGFSIVARAVEVGLKQAVKEMIKKIQAAHPELVEG